MSSRGVVITRDRAMLLLGERAVAFQPINISSTIVACAACPFPFGDLSLIFRW